MSTTAIKVGEQITPDCSQRYMQRSGAMHKAGIRFAIDMKRRAVVSCDQKLDNCTADAPNVPMEGTLMNKRSRIQIDTDAMGRPIYAQISGRNEAERFDNSIRAIIKSGRIWDYMPADIKNADVPRHKEEHPFSEAIWNWYRLYKEASIAATYKVTLKGRIKRLCSHFGDIPVESIDVGKVQEFLNTLSDMTEGTVEAHRKLLANFLDNAIEDEWIVKNPAHSKRLQNPGCSGDGIIAYERDDAKMLCARIIALENPTQRFAMGLMLFAGLRREEMLALRWEDVDFENNIIYVRRAAVMPSDAPIIKETKTGVIRPVALCDMLKDMLLPFSKDTGYIVLDDRGRQFTKSSYKKFWSDIKNVMQMPDLDARKLRHTYATYNHAAGVEDKTLAALMGHSNVKTTMNIYTQVDMKRYGEIRNSMIDFLYAKSS